MFLLIWFCKYLFFNYWFLKYPDLKCLKKKLKDKLTIFSNGFYFQMKKSGVFWKLVIGKKSMLTKLNKQKYAHKDNRLVASWCCLFSFESFVKQIFWYRQNYRDFSESFLLSFIDDVSVNKLLFSRIISIKILQIKDLNLE